MEVRLQAQKCSEGCFLFFLWHGRFSSLLQELVFTILFFFSNPFDIF